MTSRVSEPCISGPLARGGRGVSQLIFGEDFVWAAMVGEALPPHWLSSCQSRNPRFSFFPVFYLLWWKNDLEKELEALLWICFSPRYLLLIFEEKKLKIYFSSKIKNRYLGLKHIQRRASNSISKYSNESKSWFFQKPIDFIPTCLIFLQ